MADVLPLKLVDLGSGRGELVEFEAGDQIPQTLISGLADALAGKQPALISGENIKTVNGQSLLGSGGIEIAGGADLAQMHAVALSF